MTYVYIVLGQRGEYSDREVWVAGVYATEAEAQAAVVERMEVRMVYGEWSRRRNEAESKLLDEFEKAYPGVDYVRTVLGPRLLYPELWVPYAERLEQQVGPQPEEEPAEYVALIFCPVGHWGKWDNFESWLEPKDVPPKEEK